jgi:phage internal scaffolding protein
MIHYRGHNSFDLDANSNDFAVHNDEPSMTVQSQAEDADINVLMRRYGITGKMPDNVKLPTYGDFTHVMDYRSAFDAVRQANERFMEIPAEVRARFNHDPQQLLDFVENPANADQLVQLGLAKPRPPAPAAPQQAPQTGGGETPTT